MRTCRDCPSVLPPSDGHPSCRPILCDECRRAARRARKRRNRARRPKKEGEPRGPGSKASRCLQRVRDHVNSRKAAPCSDCGGTFPPVCMDFDHRRGEEKVRDVSKCRTVTAAEAEMAKCDLVCANCHRIRTSLRAA